MVKLRCLRNETEDSSDDDWPLAVIEEECHPAVRGVRAGKSVLGAEKTECFCYRLSLAAKVLITGEPPQRTGDRRKTEFKPLHRHR